MRNIYMERRDIGRGGNGFVIGAPGTGKTYSMVNEIKWVLKNTDETVYLIGDASEFMDLATEFSADIIRPSDTLINPLTLPEQIDFNLDYEIYNKFNLITSLINLYGGQLNNVQKSVLSRLLHETYKQANANWSVLSAKCEEVIKNLNGKDIIDRIEKIKEDVKKINDDFLLNMNYEAFIPQEAIYNNIVGLSQIIKALERYMSNSQMKSETSCLVIYDIGKISSNDIDVCQLLSIEDVRIRVENKIKAHGYTRLYIDPADSLLESSTDFINHLYRRSRLSGLMVTAVIQELNSNREKISCMANCSYLEIYYQKPLSFEILAHYAELEPKYIDWLKYAKRGRKVVILNNEIIPSEPF